MATDKIKGLNITGRLKESEITVYTRNGRTVARTASSNQSKRRTCKQFIARQQMMHSNRLWDIPKICWHTDVPRPATAYARFLSLMHRTEAVFLSQKGPLDGATLLLSDMPLSEGLLST